MLKKMSILLILCFAIALVFIPSLKAAETTTATTECDSQKEICHYTKSTTETTEYDEDKHSIQCENGDGTSIKDLIDKYWTWIMILAPIALILLISVDMLKSILSSNEDGLKKAGKNAINRTIAVIVLLFLPYILELVLGWFGLELCF